MALAFNQPYISATTDDLGETTDEWPDGQAGDGDIQCCRFPCVPSSNEDVSRSGVVKVSSEAMAFLHTNAQVARQQRSMNSFHKPKPVEGTIDGQEEE
ncbi:hypothetical protein EMCRGX_G020983 [Ephydatia muelleri]